MKKTFKILLTLFFSIILLLGFTETANILTGNWYQQFMPSPAGGQIRDIYFIDSLLGFAVSDSSILKTTNGGDNWSVKLNGFYLFERVMFLNLNTGFVCGGNNTLLKTTNGGDNWSSISLPSIFPYDMNVLNQDTIWLVNTNGLTGGVFRTTNGGVNWTQQFSGGNQNPNKIYMYNARIGFMGNSSALPNTYKTTNSGLNWFQVLNKGFNDMVFTDSLTGWSAYDTVVGKTTNGGLTWTSQALPYGGNIFVRQLLKFCKINTDTLWGYGGIIAVGGSPPDRGILYRTTNGGANWLFQLPDTSIHIFRYHYGIFINKNVGWAYSPIATGIHTTTGGDTTFLTGVQQISNNIPKEFKLYQNYPNPFNPTTKIRYELKVKKFVKLKVYDITGKEVITLVNQTQSSGIYQVDFAGAGFASGVYLYSLIIDGNVIDTKKMILLK